MGETWVVKVNASAVIAELKPLDSMEKYLLTVIIANQYLAQLD